MTPRCQQPRRSTHITVQAFHGFATRDSLLVAQRTTTSSCTLHGPHNALHPLIRPFSGSVFRDVIMGMDDLNKLGGIHINKHRIHKTETLLLHSKWMKMDESLKTSTSLPTLIWKHGMNKQVSHPRRLPCNRVPPATRLSAPRLAANPAQAAPRCWKPLMLRTCEEAARDL